MVLNELAEMEVYRGLLAGILRQAIMDYVGSKRLLIQNREVKARWNLDRRIKSCEKFFADPPYDYGDLDFALIKKLCDEKAEEGTMIHYRDLVPRKWTN